MIFGAFPLDSAFGAILLHSQNLPSGRIKKGTRLTSRELVLLEEAGAREVMAVKLEEGDAHEDAAASAIAEALGPAPDAAGVSVSAAFTGRANLYAARAGLFEIDPQLVADVNALDEAITLATIKSDTWVGARRMLATVKIIPYAAPQAQVDAAVALIAEAGAAARPTVRSRVVERVRLVLTRTQGMSDRLIEGGRRAVADRLAALGLSLGDVSVRPHTASALAETLADGAETWDLTLVFAGSATSDRRDVTPDAIVRAGGRVERLGMPVDPGNLLALGDVAGRPVLGLPGCARSPALNGADWVLERLVAGRTVTSAEIAAMGHGGLLKEIASRPSPRAAKAAASRPKVAGVLLAAGASTRFGENRHKLLEPLNGRPLIRIAADALTSAALDDLVVVVGAREDEMRAALDGVANIRIISAADWREGMAASLRAGIAAIAADADAVLVALADMPAVDAGLVRRLVAAFDPEEGREIVRPTAQGRPGHPVVFGRRFFEALAALEGDVGARAVVSAHSDRLVDVAVEDDAPLVDLDTIAAFDAYRSSL